MPAFRKLLSIGCLISYDAGAEMTEPLFLVESEDSSLFSTEADRRQFSLLFNGIESADDLPAQSQADLIASYWREQAGICFPENDAIRLITIWFNGSDPYSGNDRCILHCGHAAVLVQAADNEVLLLEKLSYDFPFQLIRFPSEDAALDYIVEFNCGETEGSEILPVVFVNDKPLRAEGGRFVY